MGMFSTVKKIISSTQTLEFQIKCGWDMCKTYHFGDMVDQHPIKDCPGSGYLLDDVYEDGCGEGFVVIKDAKIVEVETKAEVEKQAAKTHTENDGWINCYGFLRDKWQIQDPPRNWWSEELWEIKSKRDEEAKIEREKFEESISQLSPQEQLSALLVRSLSRRINYSELAKRLITIEPLEMTKKYDS